MIGRPAPLPTGAMATPIGMPTCAATVANPCDNGPAEVASDVAGGATGEVVDAVTVTVTGVTWPSAPRDVEHPATAKVQTASTPASRRRWRVSVDIDHRVVTAAADNGAAVGRARHHVAHAGDRAVRGDHAGLSRCAGAQIFGANGLRE